MTVYNSTDDVETPIEEVEVIDSKANEGEVECTLSDILFPVQIIDNPKRTNSEYRKVVVGQVDNGEAMELNYCSKRYELVPNVNIFPQIEEVLKKNKIEFTAKYRHIDNVRFYCDIDITDKRYAYKMKGTSDNIRPMLKIQHSYNGQTKYKITFGYFRLVCKNGLTIAVQEMKAFNLVITGKHTASILHSIQQLDKMLKYFAANAQEVTTAIVSKYELLGGRMITNVQDRVKEVLNANKIAVIDNSKFNTLNEITKRIDLEAKDASLGYKGRVTDFLVYNAINRYIFDSERTIAAPEKKAETDSKVFEYMLEHGV